jgi:hypothetical protein
MSREYNLHFGMKKVEAGNRQSLLDTLAGMSEFDCDFSGDNGNEYAWDVTLEKGFESNLEYLLNEVKDIEDDGECIDTFFEEWMGKDSYYAKYEVNYLTDEKGRVVVIGFATMCGY